MKKVLFTALIAAASVIPQQSVAQSIDYGMLSGEIQSPAGTPMPISTGAMELFVTDGVYTPNASSTLSDILANMQVVSSSFTQISGAVPGIFAASGIAPVNNVTSLEIPTGTRLYLLASTGSVLWDLTAPWALFTGSDSGWFSPDTGNPFAQSIIELSLPGSTIVSAGFGGPGVGAYFDSPGTITAVNDPSNVILVPEPSTYALLALSGLALGGYAMRRRRRA